MTVGDLFSKITNSDRLRIVKQDDGKDIFVGFLGVLTLNKDMFNSIAAKEVVEFRANPEIRHKQWKERNLMRPLEPDETPDYCFSDLEMKLYYTIYV